MVVTRFSEDERDGARASVRNGVEGLWGGSILLMTSFDE